MIAQVTDQSYTEVHSSRTQESNVAQQTKRLPYKLQVEGKKEEITKVNGAF